jgi:hypothetical protein
MSIAGRYYSIEGAKRTTGFVQSLGGETIVLSSHEALSGE